jgi:hypothetical protein
MRRMITSKKRHGRHVVKQMLRDDVRHRVIDDESVTKLPVRVYIPYTD